MNHLLTKAPVTDVPGRRNGLADEPDGQSPPRASGCQATCLGQCRYSCGGCWTDSCVGHCSSFCGRVNW